MTTFILRYIIYNAVLLFILLGLPNITTSEETVIKNKSVKLVGDVFVYDGSPDITEVFWTKNGEKIYTQGSGGRLSTVTVDDPSLTIRDVSHIDAGEYQLIARNAVGTTSSDIITIGILNYITNLSVAMNDLFFLLCCFHPCENFSFILSLINETILFHL